MRIDKIKILTCYTASASAIRFKRYLTEVKESYDRGKILLDNNQLTPPQVKQLERLSDKLRDFEVVNRAIEDLVEDNIEMITALVLDDMEALEKLKCRYKK
jgi:hypothetical protein